MSGSRLCLWILAVLTMVFLLAPIVVIIAVSFNETSLFTFPPPHWSTRWYVSLWQSRSWREAGIFSFTLASLVALAALCLGVPAAYGLARDRFYGHKLLEGLLISPTLVPAIVLALGLYMLFSPMHLIGTALKDSPDDLKKLRHYFNHTVKGRTSEVWQAYYEARGQLP